MMNFGALCALGRRFGGSCMPSDIRLCFFRLPVSYFFNKS